MGHPCNRAKGRIQLFQPYNHYQSQELLSKNFSRIKFELYTIIHTIWFDLGLTIFFTWVKQKFLWFNRLQFSFVSSTLKGRGKNKIFKIGRDLLPLWDQNKFWTLKRGQWQITFCQLFFPGEFSFNRQFFGFRNWLSSEICFSVFFWLQKHQLQLENSTNNCRWLYQVWQDVTFLDHILEKLFP